jgi:dTDP-4-dehydrorhamnose reductase
MTWLVVGGSGQLGVALQTELAKRHFSFIAPDSHELDVTSQLKVSRLINLVKPTVIINAAAWTDVDGAETNKLHAYEVNILGPQYLASASSILKAQFVQISTDYVFSGIGSTPWDETADHDPQSVYGATKSGGEKDVLNIYPSGSYIVRTAWLYSSTGNNFAKTMTRVALSGQNEVRVVNDQIGQPTFAKDLAKQIVDLVLSDAPVGIYHGTNSGQSSWFEFAKEIFRLSGADDSRVAPAASSEFARPATRPMYSVLGHNAWLKTQVPVMRNWKIALAEAMPAIISVVEMER